MELIFFQCPVGTGSGAVCGDGCVNRHADLRKVVPVPSLSIAISVTVAIADRVVSAAMKIMELEAGFLQSKAPRTFLVDDGRVAMIMARAPQEHIVYVGRKAAAATIRTAAAVRRHMSGTKTVEYSRSH